MTDFSVLREPISDILQYCHFIHNVKQSIHNILVKIKLANKKLSDHEHSDSALIGDREKERELHETVQDNEQITLFGTDNDVSMQSDFI